MHLHPSVGSSNHTLDSHLFKRSIDILHRSQQSGILDRLSLLRRNRSIALPTSSTSLYAISCWCSCCRHCRPIFFPRSKPHRGASRSGRHFLSVSSIAIECVARIVRHQGTLGQDHGFFDFRHLVDPLIDEFFKLLKCRRVVAIADGLYR